ncbi:MAG: MetQ/NlpA family ABC transporter substrate-binding protein [Breznakia sp.]
MKKLLSLVFVCSLLLVGCGGSKKTSDDTKKVIKVGATAAPHAEILDVLKADFEKEGYTLKVQVFDDYTLLNGALHDEELDANFFQHRPFLSDQNEANGYDLLDLVGVHFEPLGIYSENATEPNADFSINDVNEGAKIAIPNDTTNCARALLLLESKGIIALDGDKGLETTAADIKTFNKNVEIIELNAEGIAAALKDVDFAVVNGNYALSNEIGDKYIVGEAVDSEAAKTYENVIAIRSADKGSEKAKVLKKVLHSDTCKKFIEKTYGSIVVATF